MKPSTSKVLGPKKVYEGYQNTHRRLTARSVVIQSILPTVTHAWLGQGCTFNPVQGRP
ncbi:MAG: hypothetical protein ACRDJF_02485 [Actinomycetota bacterium]